MTIKDMYELAIKYGWENRELVVDVHSDYETQRKNINKYMIDIDDNDNNIAVIDVDWLE